MFPNILHMKYCTDLILVKAFCIFIFFYFPDSRLSVLRVNAQKNRAKSASRGHSSKPNLLSFSVCNKVLMSL